MASEEPRQPSPARPPPPTHLPGEVALTKEKEFEKCYHEAYKFIDQGITLLTQGSHAQASVILQKGLSLIDNALAIKVESFDCSAEKIQQYVEMQMKMRCTREGTKYYE
ncbi:hypothetical protein SK128_005500 [Halocaridina rubra]|uniref:Uncharacterized protein n=1 Tax=Halocaridina rubra TaxID=373956 RepID=A0AAN8WSN4_HALRR